MRRAVLFAMLLSATRSWALTPQSAEITRFRPVDILIEPLAGPIAAYQVEVTIQGDAVIVGVEGGDHPAFQNAPYYDPAALNHGRIIIAAFSTDQIVPARPFRAATLHVRERGTAQPDYNVQLITAASPNGERVEAAVSLRMHRGEDQ